MDLSELANHLEEEVRVRCSNDDNIEGPEDAFTEVMLGYLSEGNEVDSWELGFARKPGRKNAPAYKINAWNLHEQTVDQEGSAPLVDLFVSIYKPGASGSMISKAEVSEHFSLARSFLDQALNAFGGKLPQMEESAPPYEAAQKILAHRDELDSARIFLLTNGVVKESLERDVEIRGIEVKHYLWDLEKLRRLLSSGRSREMIEIDLCKYQEGGVPCIAQEDGTGEYTAYLAFFTAPLLAGIYGDFGPRLLEKNVRSFLQARGKVNKGIQATIREEPHRFLAYNNGISATAESVELRRPASGEAMLTYLKDFQIVNGGQTTASIYHAVKKEKADIGRVAVQVKLTVAHEKEKVAEFVPLISRYANSQNKVNVADFSANDTWHQRLEELSRTIWAPSRSGMGKGTRWYYERARGSYLDDKMRSGPPSKRKEWEVEHPVFQKFTKTDVAKFEHIWNQLPHVVGRGAEKNFVEWTLARQKAGASPLSQAEFEGLCAKALLFTSAEKLVGSLKLGGYKANVVAYTLAWLSHKTSQRIDLTKIWQRQAVGAAVLDAIRAIAPVCYRHLVDYAGTRNVTEIAKKMECWMAFREVLIEIPPLTQDLVGGKHHGACVPEAVGAFQPAKISGAEAVEAVRRIKSDVWMKLSEWGVESGQLKPWQVTMCKNFHEKLLNDVRLKQDECRGLLGVLEAARKLGFNL